MGNEDVQRQMARARKLASNVLTPSKTPPLSPRFKTTGDPEKDAMLHLKILTGTLSTEEKEMIYGPKIPPARAIVTGLNLQKATGEYFTPDEIEVIVEHHAQHLFQVLTAKKKSGTSVDDANVRKKNE